MVSPNDHSNIINTANSTPSTSSRQYYTNNNSPPCSQTILTAGPQQSPRFNNDVDNQHLSPTVGTTLCHQNSMTSSRSSGNTSIYTTASIVTSRNGMESGGHPVMLFNSSARETVNPIPPTTRLIVTKPNDKRKSLFTKSIHDELH
jgi:hypothetical protein